MSTTDKILSKISPASNINMNQLSQIVFPAIGASLIMDNHSMNNEITNDKIINEKNINNTEQEKSLNLWQFLHLYTIGGIPIVDYILVYLALYFINKLFLKCYSKLILIGTIPLVILIHILINKNVNISPGMIIIFIICVTLLLLMKPQNN